MADDDLVTTLHTLGGRLAALRAAQPPLTEADTCGALVEPVLAALGWQVSDVLQVRRQYRLASSDNPVDYALVLEGAPVLFVEAKALSGDLDDNRWRNQTLQYAYHANVEWCALTNGLEWRLYKTMAPGDHAKKLFRGLRIGDPAAASYLRLLTPAALKEGAAGRLWHEERAEALVRAAFREVLPSREFARMVSKALIEPLPMEELTRAIQRIGLPTADATPAPASPDAPPQLTIGTTRHAPPPGGPRRVAPEAKPEPDPSPADGPEKQRMERMPALFADGRLRAGQRVRLRKRPQSEATIVDARLVLFADKQMSWNEWGQTVTGWPTINIYDHAETEDGTLIGNLRRPL